jgi:hypothetical protein
MTIARVDVRSAAHESYAARFWEHRLQWFEIQSAHHLIGEIDHQATGNGVIVCKDGFRATTADRTTFEKLAAGLGVTPRITEVDGSTLFYEIVLPQNAVCSNDGC